MANENPPRGSLFGPLVLIAIGALFLLRNQIPGFHAYEFVARYWPALLIIWGLVRLVEHYSAAPGAMRGGLTGGEVVLLILVVFVGLGLSASLRLRNTDWGRQVGWQFWDPFERSFPFTANSQAALPPGMTVLVRSSRGDVELVAGAAGSVAALVHAEVRGDSATDARARFQQSQPLLRVENGQFVVLPAGEQPGPRIQADLQLTLPPNTPVVVETDHGDIRAANWRANLDLTSDRGDVTASDVTGNLRVHLEHGDVTVQKVSGKLQLDGNGGDVSLSDIGGRAVVMGDFTGELDFSRLPAGLEFSSSRTQMAMAALPGSLNMDMGDLHVQEAAGLRVQTRDKDIAVEKFQGALQVDDAHGAISAVSGEPLRQPVSIQNRDGDITVTLPPASAFKINAQASDGSISGDFGFAVSNSEDSAQAQAEVGAAGPALTLRTSNGAIAVRKASTKTPSSGTY